ncbi:TatD family hydrolase [Candidatus Woesearchaeota archaeon]|nr:TatD family hydrolase [Candidatus Woesearchaeota archaeon]
MALVDVHCHLTHINFKQDLDKVLENAHLAGVKRIITAGVNPETNRECLELARLHPDIVKCTLGIYPIDALNLKENIEGESGLSRGSFFDVDKELAFIEQNKDKIAGIGEAGLDFKMIKDDLLVKKQKENFQKVIELAEKLKKPLVVHSRSAEKECVEMLESSKLKKVVLHCFEGRKSVIKTAADAGMNFSIPAIIGRLQHFQMLVDMAGINQLLTETDAPWLSPVVGTRNEPANVALTIKKIAEIKKMTAEETANNVFMNYQRVFE